MSEIRTITDAINKLANRIRKIESSPSPSLHYTVIDNAVGDGVIDDSIVIQAAIDEAYELGCRTIVFPPGRYLINSQLTIPCTDWDTRPIRLTGFGSTYNGNAGVPEHGTILDLRYNGAGVAKIDTRGWGAIEIDHITFVDDGLSSLPFIQSTNTELLIHNCEFHGNPSKSGVTCDQDAIVLGGTDTFPDLSDDSPFQGYGTVIEKNYFSRIRRGIYGRTYCNGVVIQNNTWWGTCGGIAAIEYLGVVADKNSGGFISGNLIEVAYYNYAMKFDNTVMVFIVGNNYYDYTGALIAYIRFESGADGNIVIDGFQSGIPLAISDAGTNNTRITSIANHSNHFASPVGIRTATIAPDGGLTPDLVVADPSDNTKWLGVGFDDALDVGFIYAVDQGSAWKNLLLAHAGGKVGIGTTAPKSALHVVGLPTHANNAAALLGGLTAGAFYRTGGDPDLVCVVH